MGAKAPRPAPNEPRYDPKTKQPVDRFGRPMVLGPDGLDANYHKPEPSPAPPPPKK